ncbi:hypothetical protein LXL04_035320 [Taraxacum kok-saghyz]
MGRRVRERKSDAAEGRRVSGVQTSPPATFLVHLRLHNHKLTWCSFKRQGNCREEERDYGMEIVAPVKISPTSNDFQSKTVVVASYFLWSPPAATPSTTSKASRRPSASFNATFTASRLQRFQSRDLIVSFSPSQIQPSHPPDNTSPIVCWFLKDAYSWWDELNNSPIGQDLIFHVLSALYGVVTIVALGTRLCPDESPPRQINPRRPSTA